MKRWAEEGRGHTTACWIWLGCRDEDGYGLIRRDKRVRKAHRWVYESLVGAIPPGLTLDHLCRVRECVNPDHLEPVTNVENVMRGESLWAQNARKTHCVHGHEFTPENTYVTRVGKRACRACQIARYYRRKAEAA